MNVRKPILLLVFCLVIIVILFSFKPNQQRYLIDETETIDKIEAVQVPPRERWHEIMDLKATNSIQVLCYPSSYKINDPKMVKEIITGLQNAKYVAEGTYPVRDPDVKLYFQKVDGFVMAGRFFVEEGIINSPEGPIIKIDKVTTSKIMNNPICRKK